MFIPLIFNCGDNMRVKKIYIFLIIILLVITLTGCKKDKLNAYSKTYFEYFNTVSTITGYELNQEEFDLVIDRITPLLDKYHKLYDIYYEYSNYNNICTINKKAGIEAVIVDQEIIDLINYSIQIYNETNHMMNVAMGSVLKLWHEEREYAKYNPSDASLPDILKLEEANKHTDISKIIIDDEKNTIYLADKDMSLDVGAIAKGYVAEKIGQLLKDLGKDTYMVNLGGNIKLIGSKPNDEKWKVGIQNPDLNNNNVSMLELSGYSIVTSGSYQRYYMIGDVRYHHIIDPISLMPKNDYLSVTIVTKNSALADALSTALFNVSIDEGKQLISKYNDTYAMWIDSNKELHYSNGFEELLVGE